MTVRDVVAYEVRPEVRPRMLEVFSDWGGIYRWRLIGADGTTLSTSGTLFPTRASARRSAEAEAHQLGVEEIVDDE